MSGTQRVLSGGVLSGMLLIAWLPGCAEGAKQEAAPWYTPEQPGPWDAVTEAEEIASREGVPLALQIWYPSERGDGGLASYDGFWASPTASAHGPAACDSPRPVVVFSHGNEGIRWQSYFLTEYLTSHGFIVAAPDHTANTMLDADSARMAEVVLRRPWDVADAFDRLVARSETPGDALEGCVDAAAGYAVVGHSFGGYTALAAAGAYVDVARGREVCAGGGWLWLCGELDEIAALYGDDAIIDHSDPRIWASLPMAPAAYEVLAGGLPAISAPVLLMAGSEDTSVPPEEVARIAADIQAEKRLATLVGASHYSFSNACQILPDNSYCDPTLDDATAQARVQSVSTAWLRGLLGDAGAAAYVPSPAPEWQWE